MATSTKDVRSLYGTWGDKGHNLQHDSKTLKKTPMRDTGAMAVLGPPSSKRISDLILYHRV